MAQRSFDSSSSISSSQQQQQPPNNFNAAGGIPPLRRPSLSQAFARSASLPRGSNPPTQAQTQANQASTPNAAPSFSNLTGALSMAKRFTVRLLLIFHIKV